MKRKLAAVLTALLMALTLLPALPTARADAPTYTYSVPTVYSDEITVEVFAVSYRVAATTYVDHVCVPTDYSSIAAVAEAYGVSADAVVSVGRYLRYDVRLSDLGDYRLSSGTYYIAYDDALLQLYIGSAESGVSYQTFNSDSSNKWTVNESEGVFRGTIATAYGYTRDTDLIYSLYFELPMDVDGGTVIDFAFTRTELGMVDASEKVRPAADFCVASVDGSITIRTDKTALQLAYDLNKAAYDASKIGDPYGMSNGSVYLSTADAATDAAALTAALTVLNDAAATQTEINAALAVLGASWIAPSVVSTDKTALWTAYNEHKAVYDGAHKGDPYNFPNGSLYLTEADASVDSAALAAAMAILVDVTASQQQIDAALAALNTAWIAPSTVTTDKTALLAAYNADKAIYDGVQKGDPYDMDNGSLYLSEADAAVDKLALAAALLVLDNSAASQAVIDAALVALNTAWIAPYAVSVNTFALDAAILDAETFMASDSYALLGPVLQARWEAAYATAVAVRDDATHTQHEVDDAAALLNGLPRSNIKYGDADCSGTVNPQDAAAILRDTVKIEFLSAQGRLNADVDGIVGVTAADAACILRWSVKLIAQFPVEAQP